MSENWIKQDVKEHISSLEKQVAEGIEEDKNKAIPQSSVELEEVDRVEENGHTMFRAKWNRLNKQLIELLIQLFDANDYEINSDYIYFYQYEVDSQ